VKRGDLAQRVDATLAGLPLEECRSCECFLGYLTQLSMDAEEDARELLSPHLSARVKVHGCLGCEPCPPAAAFAEYLRAARSSEG
jgi:hypothetical protein